MDVVERDLRMEIRTALRPLRRAVLAAIPKREPGLGQAALENDARARIDALRYLTTEVDARRARAIAECETCRTIDDFGCSMSKGDNQQSLSGRAYDFIPKDLLGRDRSEDYLRCRKCEAPYFYKRSYEFLVNGSEDYEDLNRLTFAALLPALELSIRFRNRNDAVTNIGFLHDACFFEDATAAGAKRRSKLRGMIRELRAMAEAGKSSDNIGDRIQTS